LLFPFPIYYFSSHKSASISKFERTFEAIRKNKRDYKETLRRYSFKNPKDKQVLVNMVVPFLFQILRKTNRRIIYNNSNNYWKQVENKQEMEHSRFMK